MIVVSVNTDPSPTISYYNKVAIWIGNGFFSNLELLYEKNLPLMCYINTHKKNKVHFASS